METFAAASLYWAVLCACVLICAAEDQKTITAESGQDVTLTCRAPNNNNSIVAVKWSRADLGGEYVLLYRDGHFDPARQHPSFKNRVDLQDRQMKDGDVSLILKNVTINDARAYQCRVFMGDSRSWKSINNVTLSVVPPGQTGGDTEDGGKKDGGKEDGGKEAGSVRLRVGLVVSAVLLLVVAVVVVLIYKKYSMNRRMVAPVSQSFLHAEPENPSKLKALLVDDLLPTLHENNHL